MNDVRIRINADRVLLIRLLERAVVVPLRRAVKNYRWL